jgi:hypothetical protein
VNLHAFGPAAERWAASYDAARTTLVVEPDGAVAAYETAVRLRCAGDGFELMLFLPDRRAAIATVVAADALTEFRDYDKRRFALEALAREEYQVKGHHVKQLLAVNVPALTAMRDLVQLADRLLARSWTEWRRIVFAMGLVVSNVEIVDAPDPSVPAPERAEPDGSILVWAPHVPLQRLVIPAMALQEVHRRSVFVCDGGAIEGLNVETIALRDAAGLLARASVIVAADNDDPAPARALARMGIPLCVSSTSGAFEYVSGARVYRPWSRRSVLGAVYAALGSSAPRERARIGATFSTPEHRPALVREAPLVSVVVRSSDRPALCERALRSIAAQTYPHIETIAVDDGGRAINARMRAANGTYVALLDDGDVHFPEHIASLVDVLERTRADVAYADAVVAFGSDAGVTGYSIVDRDPVELGKMLGTNQLVAPMLRALLRKTALERVGWFSESIAVGEDYELCLRLLKESDFVHLDRITAMYVRGNDGKHLSKDHRIADAHRLIYAIHPVGDRPRILEARRQVMERLEREGNLGMREPPWRFTKRVPLPT